MLLLSSPLISDYVFIFIRSFIEHLLDSNLGHWGPNIQYNKDAAFTDLLVQ